MKKAIINVLFLFPLAVTAGESLDWKTCVNETLKNNPELISAREAIVQAGADKKAAISGILPQVSGSARSSQSGAEHQDDSKSYSYGISASQLIYDGGKTIYDIKGAGKELAIAGYDYQQVSASVRYDLKKAFTGLLRAQENVAIRKGILKRRKDSTDLLRLKYEAGREHRGSLLTSEAKEAEAEYEVAEAQRSLELAKREVADVLGRADSPDIAAEGDLSIIIPYKSEPDFYSIAEQTPYIRALSEQTELANLGVKSARADFLPSINASASADRSAEDWPPNDNEWSAGVSLSIPIFEGGKLISQYNKAKSEMRSVAAEEQKGRNSAITSLKTIWLNFQDAVGLIAVRKKYLEAAEERAKITEVQYSTGLISFDNWIIIEDDFVQAEKALLEAEYQAAVSEAQWIQAIGGTLEDEKK